MRRPAPPPPERETLDTLPPAQDGRVWDLPFPPGAQVVTTWRCVGGKLLQDGRVEGGQWHVASQRLATGEDLATYQSEWSRHVTLRPYDEATPTAEEVQALLARLAAAPPPPVRRGPTEEERAAEVRRKRLWHARRAGVPAAIIEHLRGPADRPALLAVRAWAAGDRLALLLHGANQAGKSVAAAAWLSKFERGRWADAAEIGLATQPDPQGQGTAWLRQLRGASALVLDNVGARCGPAGYEEIEALIMHHLGAGRRLIVTTDLSEADLFARFGDERRNRVLSRWRLVGAVVAVEPWGQLQLGAVG